MGGASLRNSYAYPSQYEENKTRKGWIRKAPLISRGDGKHRRGSLDLILDSDSVASTSERGSEASYEGLREQLMTFLTTAHTEEWRPDEQTRRFYILGDQITCSRWKDRCYVTGSEIFKIQHALYRLEHRQSVSRPKRFEETILTQLRGMKEGKEMRIEESSSDLLQFLFNCGAIRTRKRQKVFLWDAVDHERLFYARERHESRTRGSAEKAQRVRKAQQEPRSEYVLKSFTLFGAPNDSFSVGESQDSGKVSGGMDLLLSAINVVEQAEKPRIAATGKQERANFTLS